MGMLTAQKCSFLLENSGSEYFGLFRKLIWDHAMEQYALKLVVIFGSYHRKVYLVVNSRVTQLQMK